MKALILNSGMGSRMGDLTSKYPKCMTLIDDDETILSRQLKIIKQCGLEEVVITTGLFDRILVEYCNSLSLSLDYTFVKNPLYKETNYIYSIYLAKEYIQDDIVLMHGDLIFDPIILNDMLHYQSSCIAVSTQEPLPDKDFKAVITNGLVNKIGIEFFENAVTAQPLYKLNLENWNIWLDRIIKFCETGNINCYAENAFNETSNKCYIYPYDYKERLCREIDTPEDLYLIRKRLRLIDRR